MIKICIFILYMILRFVYVCHVLKFSKDTAINRRVVEGIPAFVGVIVLSVLSIDRSVAWGSA